MRRNHTSRLIAFLLSALMLISSVVPLSALDESIYEEQTASSLGTTTLKEISEEENTGIQTIDVSELGEQIYDAEDPLFDDEEGTTDEIPAAEEDLSDYMGSASVFQNENGMEE